MLRSRLWLVAAPRAAFLPWMACLVGISAVASAQAPSTARERINPTGGARRPGGVMKQGTRNSRSITCKTSGLEVRMAEDGSIRAISIGGKSLPLLALPGGFEVVEYLGAAKGAQTLRQVAESRRGALDFAYDGGKLTLKVDVRAAREYLRFHGKLKDVSGRDRALIVSFSLPVNAWGWNWWDSLERTRRITHGVQYASPMFVGERKDIPISPIPFSALSHPAGKTGLALSVPMHHPRIYRLSYSADTGYRVTFNLGLSPATTKFPGEADFTFIVHRCDPVWGLRSAAEKYYGFFPELFTRRVPREGGSYHLNGLNNRPSTENYLAPAEVLDESAVSLGWLRNAPVRQDPAVMRYLRENRLLSIKHREPWARWHLVYPLPGHPWHDVFPRRRRDLSTTPPPPTIEEEMEMLREETRAPESVQDGNAQILGPAREAAQATLNCLVYDEHGRPRITLWHRWNPQGWHSQIPLNVDPDIPEPNRATLARRYQFQNIAGWGDPEAYMADTVSWDSLTDWTGFHLEDFRRDNFKYLDEPLSFHYGTGRLMTLCGFHAFEMARQWSQEARARNGYIMANTEAQALLFLGQFLDMAAWERSPDTQSEEDMLLLRCLMYRKPCLLYRQGGEAGLRKMLAYGIYPASAPLPGRADVEPGHTPEYRRLYLKYARRSIQIAAAGWQPVTHARAFPSLPENDYIHGTRMKLLDMGGRAFYQSAGDVYEEPNGQFSMERFGDGTNGLYFTARSASRHREAIVFIDLTSLGLADKALKPVELIEGKRLVWDVREGMMRVVLPIEQSETLLLSLTDQ